MEPGRPAGSIQIEAFEVKAIRQAQGVGLLLGSFNQSLPVPSDPLQGQGVGSFLLLPECFRLAPTRAKGTLDKDVRIFISDVLPAKDVVPLLPGLLPTPHFAVQQHIHTYQFDLQVPDAEVRLGGNACLILCYLTPRAWARR